MRVDFYLEGGHGAHRQPLLRLGLPADEWSEHAPADGMNTGGEGRDRPASAGHKRKGGGAINLDDDLPGAISQTETEVFPTPPDLPVNSLSIADVKTALRVEVQGFLGELRGVMGGMEKRLTDSMETKMAAVHTRLDDVQEQAKKQGDALASLEARVLQLENGGGFFDDGYRHGKYLGVQHAKTRHRPGGLRPRHSS